jgi:branched-chain amino acid transport system permease protein
MLGVHSLAYGLIGGLGTALGPILGVLIDVGLLSRCACSRATA